MLDFNSYDGIDYESLLAYIDSYIANLERKEREANPPLTIDESSMLRYQILGVELLKRQIMLDKQKYEWSQEHSPDFEDDDE